VELQAENAGAKRQNSDADHERQRIHKSLPSRSKCTLVGRFLALKPDGAPCTVRQEVFIGFHMT